MIYFWSILLGCIIAYCIYAIRRSLKEAKKVIWMPLNVSREVFCNRFSEIARKKSFQTSIWGKWETAHSFQMVVVSPNFNLNGISIYIRYPFKRQIALKLRGILHEDRIDYVLSGLFSVHYGWEAEKRILQEKLYEMCNPEEAQE